MHKKVLFVIATPMQIITALHMIEYLKCSADIICLKDHLPSSERYIQKLKGIGIFGLVKNIESTVVQDLSLHNYDEIFIANSTFLQTYQQQINEQNLPISIFDEGTMCYMRYFVEFCYECCACRTIYLYEPQMANFWKDSKFKIKQIPKIESNNKILLKHLNQIFNVKITDEIDPENNTVHIFFSQPIVEHTLSIKAKIRRWLKLFQKRSNWEYANEIFGSAQEKIIKYIRKKGVKLYRKFHPRETQEINDLYTIQFEYPWELYLLNHPDINVKQYSLYSSVLTASFTLGNSYAIKSYYLYPMLAKELAPYGDPSIINSEIKEFFNRLVQLKKVIPVESIDELERMCQHEV